MKDLEYLRHVVEAGRQKASKTPENVNGERNTLNPFDGFFSLYYELAKMEVALRGDALEPIRDFAVQNALDQIDARLDCADFALPGLIRMLKAHRGTPRLSEELASKIEKSLINFKYWLDEPGDVHCCFFTENHQILYHSSEYLIGLMFPDVIFPSNGMTGREHAKHGLTFLKRWITWRSRFGFSEWLCQGYYLEDILGLICLTLYAEEEAVRERSKMLIDTMIYDFAVNGFKGHLPTTHGRVYTRFIIEPEHEGNTAVMRYLFDEGVLTDMNDCVIMLASCGYFCPPAIRAAYYGVNGAQNNKERMSINVADSRFYGIDPTDFNNIMFYWGMQTYSDRACIKNSLKVFPTWNWMTNRVKAYYENYILHDEAGAPTVEAPDYTAMTQVDIYTRRTPDYILSCAQDFRAGRMGYQQHPWTASLGGRAVVFSTNPGSAEYSNRPNRWAGNLCLPRAVQHENVLLCIYRIIPDFVDYLNSHMYFPKGEMDEVIEKNGFVFGRKNDAYIAVASLLPCYWEKKDPELFKAVYPKNWEEMYEKALDYEYVAQGHANVWAVEMGSKTENGSFESFIAGFDTAAIRGDTHSFIYNSPSCGEISFGWCKPLCVNGNDIQIHGYKRYDNETCQTEFDADKIEINCEGHSAVLDFKNAKRTYD